MKPKNAPLEYVGGSSVLITAVDTGLTPYSGPWTFEQAAHLLRRTMVGPIYDEIKWSVAEGLEATIDQLFADTGLPEPPLNYRYEGDAAVPVGSTWINAPYPSPGPNLTETLGYRSQSISAWIVGVLYNEGISIQEKLTLFWHNHFPVNSILDPKFSYHYIDLLRRHAKGNFRTLVKEITINPSMLRFLDGRINNKEAPNENYARELLELFTIGKGPQVSPGDYLHYTEQDVRELARALTGWVDYGYGYTPEIADGGIGALYEPIRHDTGTKQLSHRFNNAVIPNLEEQEYAFVVDIIFQQPEVARFICRKLYQWFIYHEIDADTEVNVIEPMAQILLDHDYDIEPAVRALLSSEHFFDPKYFGVMIKNPFDYMMSILKPLKIETSQELDRKYDSWYSLFRYPTLMQMEYFHIPEVAGWKAYYREPLYYRNWISSTTLSVRKYVGDKLANDGITAFHNNGIPMRADVLAFVATLDYPHDPNSVVEEFAKILLPKPLSEEQYATLKNLLLAGLPDFEWTVEYGEYISDPENSGLAASIEGRLRSLLTAILSMPEFHLN